LFLPFFLREAIVVGRRKEEDDSNILVTSYSLRRKGSYEGEKYRLIIKSKNEALTSKKEALRKLNLSKKYRLTP